MHDVWYAPGMANNLRLRERGFQIAFSDDSDDLLSANGPSTEVKVLFATRFGNLKLSLRAVLERPLRAL
jgi:hypothetical protein